MILKLGIKHHRLKVYKDYIDDDPGLTWVCFTARPNLVTYVFEWGKPNSHLMAKLAANDQIDRFMFINGKLKF